jgi:hypothetical protein
MNLKITYKNGMVDTVVLFTECSTEELIAQIERHEYNPNVASVEIVEPEKGVGFLSMSLNENKSDKK